MKKKSTIFKLILLVLLFVGSILIVIPKGPDLDLSFLKIDYKKQLRLHKGLDLQGGTQLVYELDLSKEEKKSEAQEKAIAVMRNRIDAFGVSEPVIYPEVFGNSSRIVVQLPGIKNIEEAISLIGKTAQLKFKEQKPDGEGLQVEGGNNIVLGGAYNWKDESVLTGADFKKAEVARDETGNVEIDIEFNGEGAKKFAQATKKNIGKPIGILLDDQLLSAPTVQNEISNGKARITGSFGLKEAKNLAIQLNAGALPVPLKLAEQKNIGATLGEESVYSSILAGTIGITAVVIFLLMFYRLSGLLAVLSLGSYLLFTLSIFKLFSITLTLAGIAGFILSIGIAVDAAILILARIKEEVRAGRIMSSAITLGQRGAWSSIWISNSVSFLLSLVVFYLGTGLIKGFAITLAIGILVNLFVVRIVLEPMLKFISKRKIVDKTKNLNIILGINLKEIKKI